MPENPKSAQNNLKHIPRPVFIVTSIALIAFLMGIGTWLLYQKVATNQQQGMALTVTSQKAATPTPLQIQIPAISANTPVSPLLFGTNMGLFDSKDQVLNSTITRTALQEIHMHIIRMPIRATLSEATEMQAAQTIKSLGAVPLVILRGQLDKNVLADDIRTIKYMNTIFEQNTVYYEYGNEEDLQGVSVAQYTSSWNAVVPQLKQIALHANFVGPVNFQYDHTYLTTFLQTAQPRPDEISWHEYTCDDTWATSVCISHIDRWTNHIADARATMIGTIGTELPIMITEWNYAPNATPNDGKNNNSTFMNVWTTHALQTLAANRIFASMQYSCTNTAIPLISSNGAITTQGTMLQTQYQNIIIKGQIPAPPAVTKLIPTATASTSGTTNGSQGFTFADGGTDGWSAHSNILTLQNSAAPAQNGKHALHVAIGPLNNSDYPSISVDASGLSSYPQAGQTLSADVYIASNSVSIAAKMFVADSNDQWHSSAMTTLTAGTWVHLTYTLPGDIKGPPKQIGIQFNSPNGSTINSDVYIESVNWS